MNLLARRDVAIVSEVAGTTRDVIEVQMNLGGYAVTISDTAGIRDSDDEIEAEGVRRAEQLAQHSALKIVVIDAAEPILPDRVRRVIDTDTLVVVNKSDLGPVPVWVGDIFDTQEVPTLSAKTGDGLEEFVSTISGLVRIKLAAYEGPVPTRQRHRESLQECVDALKRAEAAVLPELAAEDVRLAVRALGRITGRVDIDEVLDTVFRDFCIGK
jgi:tRNA modification GTPase